MSMRTTYCKHMYLDVIWSICDAPASIRLVEIPSIHFHWSVNCNQIDDLFAIHIHFCISISFLWTFGLNNRSLMPWIKLIISFDEINHNLDHGLQTSRPYLIGFRNCFSGGIVPYGSSIGNMWLCIRTKKRIIRIHRDHIYNYGRREMYIESISRPGTVSLLNYSKIILRGEQYSPLTRMDTFLTSQILSSILAIFL